MNKQLKIAIVSSEAVPYSKTGGLADVAGILPIELKRLGHQVVLVLPYYQDTKKTNVPVNKIGDSYAKVDNDVSTYFIVKDEYFDRERLYGTEKGDYSDNADRFGFFCREVLDLLQKIDFCPDIIHINDWQSALIPYYLRTLYKENKFYKKTRTLLTIHNMAYQGLFPADVLPALSLSKDVFKPYGGIEFYGQVSFLKAGLISANAISTVSHKYSREIQDKEYGCGLDGVLREQNSHVYGILNGVDYSQWNPEVDKFIIKQYTACDLSGKTDCRKDLLREVNLGAKDSTPLIGMISRLAGQKGFDILAESLNELAKLNLRLIILGTGEEKYHELFKQLQKRHPDHLRIILEFNNSLAHKIEAGCDMFLMPSRYEPCGLNQIYSLKYGTIPIVRATGGLDDTIENFNPQKGTGNGFKFKEYSGSALLNKIKEALAIFKNKSLWKQVIQNGIKQDFSWKHSAQQYIELYEKILNN